MSRIESFLSERLDGIIWTTLADVEHQRLFIECRFAEQRRVSFNCLSINDKTWLWRDVTLEEPWWVTLAAVSGEVLLFTAYHDTANPDQKSVLAYDIGRREMRWFKNHFAIDSVNKGVVSGTDIRTGFQEMFLKLDTGEEITPAAIPTNEQNIELVRPFQYHEGTRDFETVHRFLEKKCGILAVKTIEYREYESFVIVSAFEGETDLANYLIVVSSEGKILMRETLGERLKGLALDSFFIMSGYLIFVKNKTELVIWRFV